MNCFTPKVEELLANTRGQSFVEVALITPLLLIALYIPIDLGLLFFTSHLTQNAVREGARIGAADPSLASDSCTMPCNGKTGVLGNIRDRMPKYLTSATITVNLSGTAGATCMRTVRVRVEGSYPFGFARIVGITTPLSIARATEMRYELQPFGNSTKC